MLLSALLLISGSLLYAQTPADGSLNPYEKRVVKYHERWQKLIPSYTKLHFYGNMGLVSLGFGWDYGRRNQWETDIFFGIIPRYSSDQARATLTIRQNYIPWRVKLAKNLYFDPLTCALYLNSILDNDFWVKEPERYPKGYYGFSTKIRTNIALGGRFDFGIPSKYRITARAVSLYYEFTTNDFLLMSGIPNKHLTPAEYISLAFGLKFQMF